MGWVGDSGPLDLAKDLPCSGSGPSDVGNPWPLGGLFAEKSATHCGELRRRAIVTGKSIAGEESRVIPALRQRFNDAFTEERYRALLDHLRVESGSAIEFRVAETPVFVEESLLQTMANEGAMLTQRLLTDSAYLEAARRAIPQGYAVANESPHPHFLTADFALVHDASGELVPRLVEIQAFPSVFAFQELLVEAQREVFGLPDTLGSFLGGLDEAGYWDLLRRTVLGGHDPKHVVLTEVDPEHQKTRPDFNLTARRLGISVVDITRLKAIGGKLHYRDENGELVRIERIYNRAIADELIARGIRLSFDLTYPWDVEWAGHPNWYFLISKFSVPWLTEPDRPESVVPPAVFLKEFLEGSGRETLAAAGVPLPVSGPDAIYSDLLLKPLFSFAGKGIEFEPTQALLEAIPKEHRGEYLLQQRMTFVPTIETPYGITQAEFRILYLWPDGSSLTPALSLVRLGRGKMMGVDHNRNQAWVGASAAYFPRRQRPDLSPAEGAPRKS